MKRLESKKFMMLSFGMACAALSVMAVSAVAAGDQKAAVSAKPAKKSGKAIAGVCFGDTSAERCAKIKKEIQKMVDRETKAWNTEDVSLLLSIFHPDMAWPFPPGGQCHDPETWIWVLPQFDKGSWGKIYRDQFKEFDIGANNRVTRSISVAPGGKAAMAVVDVDTYWHNVVGGPDMHWHGRAAKLFSFVRGEWKLIAHPGLLEYPPKPDCTPEF